MIARHRYKICPNSIYYSVICNTRYKHPFTYINEQRLIMYDSTLSMCYCFENFE